MTTKRLFHNSTQHFYSQFERILAEESVPEKGEAYLGALTAGERKPWAEARMRFFRKGVNAASLDIIGRCSAVVL